MNNYNRFNCFAIIKSQLQNCDKTKKWSINCLKTIKFQLSNIFYKNK